MSVFVLKLIALGSMLLDHVSYVLRLSGHLSPGQLYYLGRAIGRPAFVIYCFLLVNGFDKTRDRKKYLDRLILFALLSQLPFTLAFTRSNYLALSDTLLRLDAVRLIGLLIPLLGYYFLVNKRRADGSLLSLLLALLISGVHCELGGLCLLDGHMNVFATLAAGMACMMLLSYGMSEERNWLTLGLMTAALGAELYLLQRDADYGLMGVALITALFLTRNVKPLQLMAAALWCFAQYRTYTPYLVGALCALLPIALYNGQLGRKLRTAFYVFYPAHLALLGTVFILLSRM